MTVMTPRPVHIVSTTLAIAVAAVAVISAAVTFKSTFKSIDAGGMSFAGKKVAALVISDNDSLRMSGEEALVRELNARGMQAVATYRFVPKEELKSADTAKPWFERNKVEGVVVIRPVSADTSQNYSTVTWTSASYGSFWGYYGQSWGSVYVFGPGQKETTVVVESTIYSVTRNQLMWAAVTETRNPKGLSQFVEELAKESVKEMQKQGLAKGQPKK
jgi:hypothetical protein